SCTASPNFRRNISTAKVVFTINILTTIPYYAHGAVPAAEESAQYGYGGWSIA
ncbi:MAG: hypothetical protein HYU84_13320, partial [Chloroflexi bacterium]|nr:hypothetical protein [Chloroflexota bacterium]